MIKKLLLTFSFIALVTITYGGTTYAAQEGEEIVITEELSKLNKLYIEGVITEEEFSKAKSILLDPDSGLSEKQKKVVIFKKQKLTAAERKKLEDELIEAEKALREQLRAEKEAEREAKKALNKIIIDLKNEFTADNVSGYPIDVTNEASVKKCFNALLNIFGGIDILISSVGINTEASFEDTTLSLWNKNFSVLSTGYFLVAKESFKIMKKQSKGGSIIFVVSKNGMIPSNKVSSYCSAKAAEIQLSRCIALEGAKYNIRSNVVNPDAVIKESNLWTDELKSKRSRTYNIKISELENYYKNRSLLKKSVYGKDIAEAIYHFCLETSQKSTGNILNVDAGHVATFSR